MQVKLLKQKVASPTSSGGSSNCSAIEEYFRPCPFLILAQPIARHISIMARKKAQGRAAKKGGRNEKRVGKPPTSKEDNPFDAAAKRGIKDRQPAHPGRRMEMNSQRQAIGEELKQMKRNNQVIIWILPPR